MSNYYRKRGRLPAGYVPGPWAVTTPIADAAYQYGENEKHSGETAVKLAIESVKEKNQYKRDQMKDQNQSVEKEKDRAQKASFHQDTKPKFPIPPKDDQAIMKTGGAVLLGDSGLGHTPESAFKLAQTLADTYGWNKTELAPAKAGGFLGMGAAPAKIVFTPPKGYSEKATLSTPEEEQQ